MTLNTRKNRVVLREQTLSPHFPLKENSSKGHFFCFEGEKGGEAPKGANEE